MAYNLLQKLNDNLAAIRVALEWEKNKPLQAAEVERLQKYAGFGGIKAVLYPQADRQEWIRQQATEDDLRLYPKVMELHMLIQKHFTGSQYKEVVQSIKNSVLTAFYTPAVVPETLYGALKEHRLQPQKIYEPSSGAGGFISEAVKFFPGLQQVTAVEKDILTGRVLQALCSCLPAAVRVHSCGFEEAPVRDNGQYDLIVSNIPFGNFSVYDPAYPDHALSDKIHNYFFAKGLDKIGDGGLLAYITTDGFLNNPSNKPAREYVFNRADFISLNVMPDNLMKSTGNTEAPSHLLLVQKNETKQALSWEERYLVETVARENELGKYYLNQYIHRHPGIIAGDEIKAGKNQYGHAHQAVWQQGGMNAIGEKLAETIREGIRSRFKQSAFQQIKTAAVTALATAGKKLTFLPVPESKTGTVPVQLGLFDTAPAENSSRAQAYIGDLDATVVDKQSARVISMVRTTAHPEHESIALLTARASGNNRYLYKLYSNVAEISFSATWMNASLLSHELENLSVQLQQYGYDYCYEGDQSLKAAFELERLAPQLFTALKSFYKEGTLVMYNGDVGRIGQPDTGFRQALFQPFVLTQKEKDFYESYISVRDSYMEVEEGEASGGVAYAGLRTRLNDSYDRFVSQYGLLNRLENRKLIGKDTALGAIVLCSLERKEGESFVRADILQPSPVQKEEQFHTDDPGEALARCLNEKGQVAIGFIAAATGLPEEEVISRLGSYIYLNPQQHQWETVDQYLSGNVVEKLTLVEQQAGLHPENVQLQRSLQAIAGVQPEKIPFELLDFNLGERWLPASFYTRFATDLFDLDASVSYFPSLDTFKVLTAGYNAKVTQEYAVVPRSGRTTYGHTLLEHALENTAPFFTYEVERGEGKSVRLPDNEAIQLAHQKIEAIRNRFGAWLQELAEADKKQLETLYNNTFNCYTLREYNGSHLTFPGLDRENLGIDDLYSSQKNAAWRIIQNRGALVDHEVGLGKTLTMIVASREMKKAGHRAETDDPGFESQHQPDH